MRPLREHSGRAVPLRRANVDTDQIIPIRYCTTVSRSGFADHLFHTWRQDQDFVLNRPEYADASVLVADPNFGTGSSREHAVWALWDFGFRVVISARFGDIFFGNATKSGLFPARLQPLEVAAIQDRIETDPSTVVTVDIAAGRARCADLDFPLDLDDFTRRRFLDGLDDIGLTERHADAIAAYERRRPAELPSTATAHTATTS